MQIRFNALLATTLVTASIVVAAVAISTTSDTSALVGKSDRLDFIADGQGIVERSAPTPGLTILARLP